MATDAQYQIFKELYDEESKRYSELNGKANLYITIITFYLGAIAFNFKAVLEFTGSVAPAKWLYSAVALVLVAALLCTVNAMRVRTFEGVCDPEKVINDFPDDSIADLAVATNRNFAQNNRIAGSLSWASVFILLAGFIQFCLFLMVFVK